MSINNEEKNRGEERLLLLIDVLGTKAIICESGNEFDDLIELLRFLFKQSNRNRFQIEGDLQITNYSDHLVMSKVLTGDRENDIHLLNRFIESAAYVHIEGLKKGLLLRGVIEKGQLLHEGNFIIGKALVDAHELEIKAKYPRVILSDNALKILSCKGDALKRVLDCKNLEQDEDNEYFVSYLKMISCCPVSCGDDEAVEFFRLISRNVLGGIHVHKSNEKVFKKWQWLAVKFSLALEFWESHEILIGRNELLINLHDVSEEFNKDYIKLEL